MKVEEEPASSDPRRVLDQILAPHRVDEAFAPEFVSGAVPRLSDTIAADDHQVARLEYDRLELVGRDRQQTEHRPTSLQP